MIMNEVFFVIEIVVFGVFILLICGLCVRENCVRCVNIWYCEVWKLFSEVN